MQRLADLNRWNLKVRNQPVLDWIWPLFSIGKITEWIFDLHIITLIRM